MTKAINNYDKTKISMAHVFLQYDQATMIHKYQNTLICWWKMYSTWKIESEQQSGSPSILDSFSCPYQQLQFFDKCLTVNLVYSLLLSKIELLERRA